jgi:hypothetical protein
MAQHCYDSPDGAALVVWRVASAEDCHFADLAAAVARQRVRQSDRLANLMEIA